MERLFGPLLFFSLSRDEFLRGYVDWTDPFSFGSKFPETFCTENGIGRMERKMFDQAAPTNLEKLNRFCEKRVNWIPHKYHSH